MSEALHIALVQNELEWHDPEKNRKKLQVILQHIRSNTDLIILPEMFTTGFTMEAEKMAETMQGPTVTWLQKIAHERNVAITGSLIIKENDAYYNRLVFVQPNKELQYYDKRHLFTLAQEHKNFNAGVKTLYITYKGWKIMPLICYDLRFPVWSRNTENYDLLLYVANWPKQRIYAWDSLLQARAIENMSYVAGVNRIGSDQKGHQYIGHSSVYDMLGQSLTKQNETREQIIYATLNKSELKATRDKLRFLDDRDFFTIE